MLERHVLHVLAAADGRQAVEIFGDHADAIDAVLLDHGMPDLTGEQAAREIHRIRPEVPILLSSGYTREEAAGHFAAEHLAGFIQKPFDVRTLLEALDAVMQPT
jgi:two-component system, cell cycle sensor histidine kinase and response regulator CckA